MHIFNIAGQSIKVVTSYVCPPIPVRTSDWVAYEDGCEEENMYGYGATEEEALSDLAWQLDEKYNPLYNPEVV